MIYSILSIPNKSFLKTFLGNILDWMGRSGSGSAGSTSVGDSSSYSNPGSSYPDIPRSVIPASHFPVEDEEGPRYYDGGENSDTGFPEDEQVHGGVNFAPLRIFGPIPSTSPTMNHSPSSSRRPGIQILNMS